MSELAWAAGFFEGEGCVYLDIPASLRKKNSTLLPYLRLNITQVDDRWPLDRFAAAVGRGIVRGPHMLRGERRRWALDYGKYAHEVMELLIPYLGAESKKTRAYIEASAKAAPKTKGG